MAFQMLLAKLKSIKSLTGDERTNAIEKIYPRLNNTKSHARHILFMYAVKYGLSEIAIPLFKESVDPIDINAELDFGDGIEDIEPILLAVKSGNLDLVIWMLTLIEQPSLVKLFVYASDGHLDIVKYLFDKYGDQIKTLLITNRNALTAACTGERLAKHPELLEQYCEIIKILVASGAKISVEDFRGNTPFECICNSGIVAFVQFFIDNFPGDVDVNIGFIRGCASGHIEVAKLFLAMGANIHSHHDNAFISALWNNHVSIISWLLSLVPQEQYEVSLVVSIHDKFANDNSDDESDQTPDRYDEMTVAEIMRIFFLCCKKSPIELIRIFWNIFRECIVLNINNCNFMKQILLGKQNPENIAEIVKFLFNECDAHVADDDIEKAIICACESGVVDLIRFLFDKYPSVDISVNVLYNSVVGSGVVPAIEYIYSKYPIINMSTTLPNLLMQCSRIVSATKLVETLRWLAEHNYQLSNNSQFLADLILKNDYPDQILRCVWGLTGGCFNFRSTINAGQTINLFIALLSKLQKNILKSLCNKKYNVTPEKNALLFLAEVSNGDYIIKFDSFNKPLKIVINDWFSDPHTLAEIRQHLGMQLTQRVSSESLETEFCVICHESHNMALSCGHYMFDTCFVKLYFTNKSSYICPYCRKTIVFSDCSTIE